jgi:murein DD-endopeptidase MepM/ murein hydrolase activator NlpD
MKWNALKERLQNLRHIYRLVIMNDETFEEVGSYRLTMLNFYILLSSIVVVVAIIVVALIAVTPLKKYIPGYGTGIAQQEVRVLTRSIDSLEAEIEAYDLYYENVQKMLVNKVETEDDIRRSGEVEGSLDSIEPVEPSDVDEQLRKEVELDQIGAIVQSGQERSFQNRRTSLAQIYFVPPLNGEISAPFAPDKEHLGVDVLAPKNTAIKAALDGYVFISDWTLETGNTIGIQHDNNIITFYKHNSSLLKKAGSYVKAGEAIAIIGNTGTQSDGPHLHFEMWYNGKPMNPIDYISF